MKLWVLVEISTGTNLAVIRAKSAQAARGVASAEDHDRDWGSAVVRCQELNRKGMVGVILLP